MSPALGPRLPLLEALLALALAGGCGGEDDARPISSRALDDVSLLVDEAERRGLARATSVRRAEKRVLAQLVLRDIEESTSRAAAPPSNDGPAAPFERRLVAYVRVESDGEAPLEDDAKALADEALARMKREGPGPVLASFRAQPPEHPRYRFTVEEGLVVAPVDDGERSLRGHVFAAPGAGPIEPVFRTPHGVYAAFVLAVWPDLRPSPEAERAEREASAVIEQRARATEALVSSLRSSVSVRFDEEALAPILGNTASSD
jgi:hypothetical protein